ncbi:internal scaffolding protein [Microviridae sp.]|nr:internal scaffolding protein [Microviridae sp.]
MKNNKNSKGYTSPGHSRSRVRVHPSIGGDSLTKQYCKQECDINYIVGKYAPHEIVMMGHNIDPQYGFAPDIDLKGSLDKINELKEEYYSLDKDTRSSFGSLENYANFLMDYDANPDKFNVVIEEEITPENKGNSDDEKPSETTQ